MIQKEIIKYVTDKSVDSSRFIDDKKKTCAYFKAADNVLADAVRTNKRFSDKIDSNNFVKQELISEAYIQEEFDSKVYKRPVVDLVQQGGGMYGVALLGYTYIMEKLGVRFYSHGGASAGGINALLMASISNKIYQEESEFVSSKGEKHQSIKSELLTHIVANKNFSDFMDRDGLVGKLQRLALKNIKFLGGFFLLFSVFILSFVYSLFGIIFRVQNGLLGSELRFYDFVIGTLDVFALFVFFYVLFVKILGRGFGINEGDEFYKWIEEVLKLPQMNISSTEDLEARLKEVRLTNSNVVAKPRLVLMASNLTHNRIVKFPEEARYYWNNYRNVKPVAYLRATMSIPFIFKVFVPSLKHYKDNNDLKNRVRLKARLVDGGMLSNFPIREFHSLTVMRPSFPSFGVMLTERIKSKTNQDSEKEITLMSFILSFISTFRNFYDNDFLVNNEEIDIRVVTVNTKGFNWLDFWMNDASKIKLFEEGAKAAIKQLEKFDWNEYKKIRENES